MISFIKIRPCIPELVRECLPKCLFDHSWVHCDTYLDLLTSKCNYFVLIPNFTEVVNLIKFSQPVTYRANKLSVYDNTRSDGRTSLKNASGTIYNGTEGIQMWPTV